MEEININNFGFEYSILLEPSFKFGSWNRQNAKSVKWEQNKKQIEIEVEYGTLIRDIVTPDGKYLVLIFKDNLQFADPCNCVIYNRDGEIHRIACASFLIGDWIKDFRKGESELIGLIRGGAVRKIGEREIVTLFIQDAKEYYKTGIYYHEARVFDPETGKIGDILSWSLPFR